MDMTINDAINWFIALPVNVQDALFYLVWSVTSFQLVVLAEKFGRAIVTRQVKHDETLFSMRQTMRPL